MYNLAKTIIESLQGMNNNGSSKRAAAAWFSIIAFIITVTYAVAYLYCSVFYTPPIIQIAEHTYQMQPQGVIQQTVIDQLIFVLVTVIGMITTALGITAYEKKVDAKKVVDLNCDKQESENK